MYLFENLKFGLRSFTNIFTTDVIDSWMYAKKYLNLNYVKKCLTSKIIVYCTV